MKVRKKTIVEALQYRAGEQDSAFAGDVIAGNVRYSEDDTMLVRCPEGEMVARPGDWIIRDERGLHLCQRLDFADTYEPAEA